MEVNNKEQKRAGQLLQSLQVNLHQIKSFSFMKRKQQTLPSSGAPTKGQYGPGILTLHLQDGKEKTVCLPPFRHPSSVVRFLVANGIAFDNYTPRQRTIGEISTTTYQRTSLYMFWFFVLFLTFLILGYYSIGLHAWWGFLTAFASFALSLFFICMLMTRFCYLTLTNEALVIHSIGRTIRYPYRSLRKVNFDFAREQNFTHVMELLDNHYRYRLFYIGRVSRKKLNEIAELLQQAGVDATCSLNDQKRYYQDKYIAH